MLTNFLDAASVSFCRGLHGVIGFYPSPCQVNAGRPALFLATVVLALVCGVAYFGWHTLRTRAIDP